MSPVRQRLLSTCSSGQVFASPDGIRQESGDLISLQEG
jgi:hypothetical protein